VSSAAPAAQPVAGTSRAAAVSRLGQGQRAARGTASRGRGAGQRQAVAAAVAAPKRLAPRAGARGAPAAVFPGVPLAPPLWAGPVRKRPRPSLGQGVRTCAVEFVLEERLREGKSDLFFPPGVVFSPPKKAAPAPRRGSGGPQGKGKRGRPSAQQQLSQQYLHQQLDVGLPPHAFPPGGMSPAGQPAPPGRGSRASQAAAAADMLHGGVGLGHAPAGRGVLQIGLPDPAVLGPLPPFVAPPAPVATGQAPLGMSGGIPCIELPPPARVPPGVDPARAGAGGRGRGAAGVAHAGRGAGAGAGRGGAPPSPGPGMVPLGQIANIGLDAGAPGPVHALASPMGDLLAGLEPPPPVVLDEEEEERLLPLGDPLKLDDDADGDEGWLYGYEASRGASWVH